MATSLVQIRVDEDLKAQAAKIYENLGIDISTAIRIFLKRSVMVGGIPFSMTLYPHDEYKAKNGYQALVSLSESSKRNGMAEMSLDEIEEEIHSVRTARAREKKS